MNSSRGIHFYTPYATFDVGLAGLEAIRAELEKIKATNPPRADVDALLDALELHTVDLGPGCLRFEPNAQERWLLLRAVDHLRNLGHKGDVIDLRDMLIASGDVKPITYKLHGIAGGPPIGFVSYSLEYGLRDRLVRADGSEYVIAGWMFDLPLEPVVDDWRPAT
jgi:hypothetical protein